MSNPNVTVVKGVVVTRLSKYGFFAGKDSFYIKNLPEHDRPSVVEGAVLDLEVWTSDKGAQYVNRIVGTHKPITIEVKPEQVIKAQEIRSKAVVNSFVPVKTDTTMTKAEWSAKDRAQMIGGRSHDAAQLTLAAVTVGISAEDVLKLYKAVLEGVLKLAEEVK